MSDKKFSKQHEWVSVEGDVATMVLPNMQQKCWEM